MYPSSVRLLVAIALFVGGTFLISLFEWRLFGLLSIVAGFYWLYSFVRYGPVKLAFMAYRKGEIERARDLLAGVWRPRLLARKQRSYYYWVHGAVAAHEGRDDDAHAAYEEALR